jgi:hypothetical protein
MRPLNALEIGILLVASGIAQPRALTPEEVRFAGPYRNVNYGYSVVIPKGLYARRMRAPAPQHGFAVDLERATMWVDAGYDATFAGSADAAARGLENDLASAAQLRVVKTVPTQLAGLEAREVVMKGGNGQAGEAYAHFVVAIRNIPGQVGVTYTIAVKGDGDVADTERVFSSVLGSFHLSHIR